jgi:hypothetical protein
MAIAAVGNNLITYVFGEMHFPLSQAANVVTNFVGTIFLLSLLGGFLSDSYLGCFWTMLTFGFVELSVRNTTFWIGLIASSSFFFTQKLKQTGKVQHDVICFNRVIWGFGRTKRNVYWDTGALLRTMFFFHID